MTAPHVPAAFINAIAEEGTKAEAIEWLQKQWNESCALRSESAYLKARIEELEAVFEAAFGLCHGYDWNTRSPPASGADVVREAFRNVDDLDWKHLDQFIPQSGHGRFWRAVFHEVRSALASSSNAGALDPVTVEAGLSEKDRKFLMSITKYVDEMKPVRFVGKYGSASRELCLDDIRLMSLAFKIALSAPSKP